MFKKKLGGKENMPSENVKRNRHSKRKRRKKGKSVGKTKRQENTSRKR